MHVALGQKLVLLLSLLFSFHSFACPNFVELAKEVNSWELKKYAGSTGARSYDETVYVDEIYKDSKGEENIILKRVHHEPWGSLFSLSPNAPQGSPTWLLIHSRKHLSQILGSSLLDDETMVVAGPKNINRRVANFNGWLKERYPHIKPLGMKFHWQIDESIFTYLEMIAKEGSFPISRFESSHTVHDISYHYSSIGIITEEFVELLRKRAQFILDVRDLVEQKYENLPRLRKGIQLWLKTFYRSEVRRMDTNATMKIPGEGQFEYVDLGNYKSTFFGSGFVWSSYIDVLSSDIGFKMKVVEKYRDKKPEEFKQMMKKQLSDNRSYIVDAMKANQALSVDRFRLLFMDIIHNLEKAYPNYQKSQFKSGADFKQLFKNQFDNHFEILKAAQEYVKEANEHELSKK